MGRSNRKIAPSRSLRARENQLVALAYDVAEEQLRNRTASSQVITEFLRRGTIREQLMNEKLKSDLEVAQAKIKQYESSLDLKEVYEEALSAMRRYSGNDEEYYEEEDGYVETYYD